MTTTSADLPDPWTCMDCGARQPEKGACRACGHEDTLDAREERVRDLMHDIDLRHAARREGRLRVIGVVLGMAIVFGLWLTPGYWNLRRQLFAIPLLVDQWLLMAVIGLGFIKLAEKKFTTRRFPYLGDDLTIR